jgi:hypothetical protein
MATGTVQIRNAQAEPVFMKVNGTGTEADPYIPIQDVNIQDQVTPLVNLFFQQADGPPTTTTAPVTIGEMEITLDSVVGFTTSSYIGVFSNTGRFYFADVISISVNTLTVDTPFDFAFPAGSQVISTTRNLAVLGSPASPQIFNVQGADSFDIDITRLIFTMTLTTNADDGLFGNIAALTNGLVLRRTDGVTRNIFNVKDNGELAGFSYDMTYTIRSTGGGTYGLRCRYTFAGQSKQGVAIRLGAGEKLEAIISDDLSGITRFRILAEGHEVI